MSSFPYETLARAEADDILVSRPTSLASLSLEQIVAVKELIASGVASGLEMGFTLSERDIDDTPGDVMEAYVAGITVGKRELERGES